MRVRCRAAGTAVVCGYIQAGVKGGGLHVTSEPERLKEQPNGHYN